MNAPRGAYPLLLRRCLAVAAPPTVLAAAAGFGLHLATPATLAGDTPPAAASPWLLLPLLVAAATCAITAATAWPTFAQQRPGGAWIRRLQRGRLGGAGAAIAAALTAQLLLTLPLLTGFARALGAPPQAHAHVTPALPTEPVLDRERPVLRLLPPADFVACALRLRPVAALPRGPVHGTRVEVFADGQPLPDGTVEFTSTGQLWRLPFAARPITQLELHWRAGTIPLYFPPDGVVLVGAGQHPGIANGALAALVALLPTWLALALGCCCGAAAALPTTVGVIASALFVQAVGGIGPLAEALLALLRGHWLPHSPVFPQCVPSLAVGSVAMIAAMLLRPRGPR